LTGIAETQRLDRENPWPGLTPYNEAGQEFFHGRDEAAAELFRRIRRDLLTVLYGKSGLGKTSLLNAGLFPLLRASDFLPVYIRLDFSNPDNGPIAQIAAALKENLETYAIDGPAPAPGESLWEFFHNTETAFWNRRNRLVTPVLVIDQFEEIFTLGQATPSAAAIVEALAALIERHPPERVREALERDPDSGRRYDFDKESCKVVLALRDDFLPELDSLRRLIPSIANNSMRLLPMNGRQARDVILRSGGHLVAEGVAERIIDFVATKNARAWETAADADLSDLEIDPALLSLVCRELNSKRQAMGQDKITADLLAGAQDEIITSFYRSSLAGLDPAVQVFIEDRLITGSGFRIKLPVADAVLIPGVSREAIDTLVGRRLLRIEEQSGSPWVELTHDRVTEIVRQGRDARRELQEAEAQRERAERAEAEAAAQAALAREAVEREQVARRLVRRTRIALGATGFALVLALVAVVFAVDSYRAAQRSAEAARQSSDLAQKSAEEAKQRAAEANQNYAVALESASHDIDVVAAQARTGGISIETAKALLDAARDTFGRLHQQEQQEDVATVRVRVRLFLNLADTYLTLGDLDASLDAAHTELSVAQQLPEANDEREAGVAYAHSRIGNVLLDEGQLDNALTEYRADLTAMLRLAAAHPDNIDYQINLSIAHDHTGDVLRDQGDLPGALEEYRAAATIDDKLLAPEPEDRYWQLDASIGHKKIGDVLNQQNDLDGALAEYRRGLELAEHLADTHPTDTDADWQRGTMHARVGEILQAQGKLDEALVEFRAELDTMIRLTAKDSGNAQWQRDLSVSHTTVGKVLYDQGKYAEALAEYRAALTIAQRLVTQQPSNALWQRDLFVTLEHIGLVAEQQGDLQTALAAYEQAEKVAMRKKDMNPTAPESSSDLTWIEAKLSSIRQRIAASKPK